MGQPVFFKASLSAVCPCTGLSTPDRTMPHVDLTPCFRCCCCCYCRLGCCAVGDIYPEGVQLKKGDYVIRAILRHDDAGLLDKLKVGGWAGGRAGGRAGLLYRTNALWKCSGRSSYLAPSVSLLVPVHPGSDRQPIMPGGCPPCCRACRWLWSGSWTPRCRWARLLSCLHACPAWATCLSIAIAFFFNWNCLCACLQVPVYDTNSDSIKGSGAVSRERVLCKGALATPACLRACFLTADCCLLVVDCLTDALCA